MAKAKFFHAIASLPGGRRKSIVNKSEDQMLTDFVIPYERTGVVRARWGSKTQSYQVLELRIYGTPKAWHKPSGEKLDSFIGSRPNRYESFRKRAQKVLAPTAYRAFVIMPIQGEKYGTQDDQRIWREYDARFEVIEQLLGRYDAVAIRIDKEHTLDELVQRIKEEIRRSDFIIADLTDERPSCYFEAGYAEALEKPTIFVASKESVINPRQHTKIHFDIHRNINMFVNHEGLEELLEGSLKKNRKILFKEGSTRGETTTRITRTATTSGRGAKVVRPKRSGVARKKQPEAPAGKKKEKYRTRIRLNEKEARVLRVLVRKAQAMTLVQLASAAFPRLATSQANSWVRNSLRRPLASKYVLRPRPGTYVISAAGRKAIGGAG